MKRDFSKLVTTLILSSLCAINAHALTIEDNQTLVLEPDNYYYDELVLGSESNLVIKGDTRILTNILKSKDGAKITYEKGAAHEIENKWLRLEAMDASQMEGMLLIDGSGADGNIGKTGTTGANGRDAYWDRWTARGAIPGNPGGKGGIGENGENGMNIEISLLNLRSTAFVSIITNGGNGGQGGMGGQGGQGGKGKHGRSPKNGGNGGQGGIGGQGGNAGDILAYLLYDQNTTEAQKVELEIQLETNIIAIPGQGGLGGIAGVGGAGGLPGECSGLSCKRGQADPGLPGEVGEQGEPGVDGELLKQVKLYKGFNGPIGAYSVSGTIYDQNQNPLERVSIQLENRDEFAVTDKTGHWQLSDLPNGKYTAIASKDGYEFEPQTFTIDKQNAEVTIQPKASPAIPKLNYLDKCLNKFKDYFGNKTGETFDCGNNHDFICQQTTGGTLGDVTGIAIPKSQQGDFHYFWGVWGPLPLSSCD